MAQLVLPTVYNSLNCRNAHISATYLMIILNKNHCKHGNEQESKFTVDWAKFVKMTGEGELISDFGKKSKKQLKD